MNIYIDQLQINKHFFLPIKNCEEREEEYINEKKNNKNNNMKNKNMKKLISKIRLYDFFSINEAKICEKVKEIPYFQNHYIILYNYDEIKAGDLRERGIINLDYYSDNKYLFRIRIFIINLIIQIYFYSENIYSDFLQSHMQINI